MKKFTQIAAGLSLLSLMFLGSMPAQETKKAPSKQGIASPHVVTTWTFGGKKISITYGRPNKNGRVVFGQLEPFNKVWRSGADEATILQTDADLMIGSVHVPKGSYSLYTTFTPTSHTLIINKQTGQWGLTYDQAQDLGRTPMKIEKPSAPVEQLTYSIDKKSESAGTLKLSWDDRVLSVDLMVH